uniref:WSC domain-containing protein n=1 Tax=Macrostomum lignano TaxID=282301 RepID=A0A1I8H162_9PLAT
MQTGCHIAAASVLLLLATMASSADGCYHVGAIVSGIKKKLTFSSNERRQVHKGCYKLLQPDEYKSQIGSVTSIEKNSWDKCRKHCYGPKVSAKHKNDKIGLQEKNCWCHHVYPMSSKTVDSDCTSACPGNSKETCGSPKHISLYSAGAVKGLYGRDIAFAHQTKCLGVILDHRLNWSFHVKAKAKRASAILAQLRRAFGTSWGLSPKRLWWIYMYTSAVRSAITYASVVWVSATQVKSHADLLNTIQGRACRLICNATRCTPFAGMGAFLNLPPLDLFVRGEVARTTRRLLDAGVKFLYMRAPAKRNLVPHSDQCLNILNEPIASSPMDCLNAQPETALLDSRDTINDHWNHGELHCYTDGSKQSANTGFGVGIFLNGKVIATHAQYTGVNSSVFQNEVLAISSCIAELLATGVS